MRSKGRKVKVESWFQTEVSVFKAKIVEDFIDAKTGRCLLGYSVAIELGILCVDPAGTLETGNCNSVDDNFVGQLKAKYPSVFHARGSMALESSKIISYSCMLMQV